MKEVESSNQNLVDNMSLITEVMGVMTDCVSDAEDTTKTMLSKYEETSVNVENIEKVVDNLVKELGSGGFMGIQDVTKGMRIALFVKDAAGHTCKHGIAQQWKHTQNSSSGSHGHHLPERPL